MLVTSVPFGRTDLEGGITCAVICHERGLSDQGKRLSVPSCVDIQCV